MQLTEMLAAIRRWWWVVALVPLVTLGLLLVRSRTMPYQTTVRATVLIPGDTEIPGSSERPELMVLDDLGPLISSRVFADAVARQATADRYPIEPEVAQAALSGSRYSRVVTITSTSADADESAAVAAAAAQVLPEAVNTYLVADRSQPATVKIIDPPGDPTRDRPNQAFIIAAQLLAAIVVGCLIAIVLDAAVPVRSKPEPVVPG